MKICFINTDIYGVDGISRVLSVLTNELSKKHDIEEARLASGKVGSGEFSDVMRACYMLYELYDAGYGFAQQDTDFINASYTIGWINHALVSTKCR